MSSPQKSGGYRGTGALIPEFLAPGLTRGILHFSKFQRGLILHHFQELRTGQQLASRPRRDREKYSHMLSVVVVLKGTTIPFASLRGFPPGS